MKFALCRNSVLWKSTKLMGVLVKWLKISSLPFFSHAQVIPNWYCSYFFHLKEEGEFSYSPYGGMGTFVVFFLERDRSGHCCCTKELLQNSSFVFSGKNSIWAWNDRDVLNVVVRVSKIYWPTCSSLVTKMRICQNCGLVLVLDASGMGWKW